MNKSDSQSSLRKKVASAEKVDKICDEFEGRLLSGDKVDIESIIGQLGEPERTNVLREILALEIDFRLRDGQSVELQESSRR